MDGRTESQTGTELWHSNLIYIKQSHMQNCSSICQSVIEKSAETYFQYSKFQKGHNSNKNWQKLTTVELDLKLIKRKSYAKFQLDISKHVREKCGKLRISSILSSKRGITPTKIDGNWRHSNLISSTVKPSQMQNFSSICQSV